MSSSPTDPATGAVEVTMPETGSDDGALLISWIKGPGSEVEADEPICIVRVGDLTAEIVSPSAGVLGGIYAEPGQQVPPGASLAEIHPALAIADCRVDPNSPGQPDTRGEMDEEETPEAAMETVEAEVVLDPLANLASEIEALELDVPQIRLPREPATPIETAEPEPEPVAEEPELPTPEPEPVAAEPELPVPEAEPEPDPVVPEPEPEPVVAEPGPVVAEPQPEPVVAEPGPVVAEPRAEPVVAEPGPVVAEPQAEPVDEAPALNPEPEPLPAPPPVELAAFRSPAVRRLAEQHRVDLREVRGTGRGGRVTRDDVLAALSTR